MSWTAPRTWVHAETVTAAGMMNPHIKANADVLKISRDDLGRFRGLSSAYVADLSGASLTGVAMIGSSNSFTNGRSMFSGTALIRVPVGADKYESDGGGKVSGSLWVEGDYLHHIDASRVEWRYLGTVINGAAGAQPGFVFLVSNALRYTDSSGRIRECVSSLAHHTDVAAVGGSAWVEGNYVHWVRESGGQSYQGHQDITHSDHSDHVDHSDHTDVTAPHGDHTDHSDVPTFHIDTASGIGNHTDHTDVTVPHSDHVDHTDHTDHTDATPHGDVATDQRPVLV